MPIVRRPTREIGIQALRGGTRDAAETAESQGYSAYKAKADTSLAKAGFGERAARIGLDAYTRIVEKEKAAADQTALLKADNQLSEWKNKYLYDPNGGALTRKGENAQPIPEEMREQFEKVTGEIALGLHSDRQREAFEKIRSQEFQALDMTVRRHVFEEMRAFQTEELNTSIGNAINAGIMGFGQPDIVAFNLQKAVSAIQTVGPGLGMGKEQIESKVRQIQTKTHVGVINNLVAAERDEEAAEYFASARGQIDGEAIDGVTRALEEGQVRGQGQAAADKIIAEGGTLTEQREKAKTLKPKVREEVERRLDHAASIAQREKNLKLDEDLRGAYDVLDGNGGDFSKIPRSLLSRLDGAGREALKDHARRVRIGDDETDEASFYHLMDLAGDDPSEFANNVNLLKYRHKLSRQDLQQLSNLQLQLKNGNRGAAEKILAPYDIDKTILDDNLTLYGYDPKDESIQPMIAQMRKLIRARGDALQSGKGGRATNDEIQQIVDDVMIQNFEVTGSWYQLWQKQSKRLIEATISDVPETFKRRHAGKSDAQILTEWINNMTSISRLPAGPRIGPPPGGGR